MMVFTQGFTTFLTSFFGLILFFWMFWELVLPLFLAEAEGDALEILLISGMSTFFNGISKSAVAANDQTQLIVEMHAIFVVISILVMVWIFIALVFGDS